MKDESYPDGGQAATERCATDPAYPIRGGAVASNAFEKGGWAAYLKPMESLVWLIANNHGDFADGAERNKRAGRTYFRDIDIAKILGHKSACHVQAAMKKLRSLGLLTARSSGACFVQVAGLAPEKNQAPGPETRTLFTSDSEANDSRFGSGGTSDSEATTTSLTTSLTTLSTNIR